LEKNETLTRESNEGNYRFIAENDSKIFQTRIKHPVAGLKSGDEILVGNPYMSSIDMLAFMKDNSTSVEPSFRIWNGKDFDDYSVDTTTGQVTPTVPGSSLHIAPLQGFFLTYKGTNDIIFNVENISTVRPAGSSLNLRSAVETKEENILRIKAENGSAASHAVIGYKEGTSNNIIHEKNVQKLFSPNSYVPEVYSLAGEIPASILFINNKGEVIVPLGIKTGRTGEIHLTFSGMNNYIKASKIELIDARENRTIDLTGKSSYTYTFNHTETGIQNGRFSLRISNSTTALPEVNGSDELKVYSDSKGIYIVTSSSDPVEKVEVYDIQGRKLYESRSNSGYYPMQENHGNSPLIVKVLTKYNQKSVKLNSF
jgi:hypothetical protein